ncbi:inositol polyphosphate-5-phosphatase A-like isoform X2 [Ptychodera flava]|uniref:inositol polyphosphate-5-phosphatase A-like isoform X2 n=1 Tax=Ptychodera flava TaxID=63121 RepID=UPI003969C25B
MTEKLANVLLITANVGSVFEEPDTMLTKWTTEFLQTVKQKQPQFIALHCQEVGGKNYRTSMQHLVPFTKALMDSEELKHYNRVRMFLDDEFEKTDTFTALGCIYFIHESLQNIFIYDFAACKFRFVSGKEIYTNVKLEEASTKEKIKFAPEFFPETKWSRKGFLRTRWSINDSIFDLVNIHLFHDACNITAAEKTPSVYSSHRRKALEFVLERFMSDKYDNVPLFIFGDFNFRLDQYGVVGSLCAKATAKYEKNQDEVVKVTYEENGSQNKTILTMEKKKFSPSNTKIYSESRGRWLRKFDREPRYFLDRLYEYDIDFPPSYPYSEDLNKAREYMQTRCPAWCDRILMSHSAKELMYKDTLHPPQYSVMGEDTCMGDHKPLYLLFRLIGGKVGEPIPKRQKSGPSS